MTARLSRITKGMATPGAGVRAASPAAFNQMEMRRCGTGGIGVGRIVVFKRFMCSHADPPNLKQSKSSTNRSRKQAGKNKREKDH
ncbi:MAG: hypothetical protein QM501_09005 [Gimesia sp.]